MNVYKTIFTVLLSALFSVAYSQQNEAVKDSSYSKLFKKNIIYTEMFGSSFLLSSNFQQEIFQYKNTQLNYRIGAEITPFNIVAIPFQIRYSMVFSTDFMITLSYGVSAVYDGDAQWSVKNQINEKFSFFLSFDVGVKVFVSKRWFLELLINPFPDNNKFLDTPYDLPFRPGLNVGFCL